jgi:DNA mismatch repair ATPase MutS
MITPDFYSTRAKHFAQETARTEKIIRQYAGSRLALVAVAIVFYFALPTSSFFVSLVALLTGFIILVRLQLKQEDHKQRFKLLQTLNEQEEKATRFESTTFPDGSRYVDPHHPYSHDLDLFGKGSVFQYINRCATHPGEDRLAHDLTSITDHSKEKLLLRQQAVHELAQLPEFRQQAWALGRQLDERAFDHPALNEWLAGAPVILGKPVLNVVRWVFPVITLSALALTIYSITYYPIFLLLFFLQAGIAGIFARKIKQLQQQLGHGKTVLGNYARIFELLSKEKMHSPLMKQHQATATAAFENVQTFSGLVNSFEARMNPIAMLFGNGLFLYDLHSVRKLEQWRKDHGPQLPGWLDSLAEWDALLSPATLHANFPEYAFAKVSAANSLEMKDAGHLLIPNTVRVNNNFSIGQPQPVWLITGANMAGKSTFLRALGVNFVLGSMGSPVCAVHWSMPLIELHTGMRTTDSLQEHQSYFFAELNRLQLIMQELRTGKPMLILLDEILKGTNSTDKQLGSRELLKQFKDLNALVVLATHDIALGDLQDQHPQQIANACFEGKIVNDELSFDYTLHAGVAQKANATFLMRRMGIIPKDSEK